MMGIRPLIAITPERIELATKNAYLTCNREINESSWETNPYKQEWLNIATAFIAKGCPLSDHGLEVSQDKKMNDEFFTVFRLSLKSVNIDLP